MDEAQRRQVDKIKAAYPSPPPKDRRVPLSSIRFRIAMEIPGLQVRVQRLTAGETVGLSDGQMCPPMFFDPEWRVICIGDYLIPLDGSTVEHVIRAKAAPKK